MVIDEQKTAVRAALPVYIHQGIVTSSPTAEQIAASNLGATVYRTGEALEYI